MASTQGSIVAVFTAETGEKVYPLHLGKGGRISISFHWTKELPRLKDPQTRAALLEEFKSFLSPLSTDNPGGFPAFPAERLCDDTVFEKYRGAVRTYVSLAQARAGN